MAKKRQNDVPEKARRPAASNVVQPEQQLDAAIAETLGATVMAAGHEDALLADEITSLESDVPVSVTESILAEAAVSAPSGTQEEDGQVAVSEA